LSENIHQLLTPFWNFALPPPNIYDKSTPMSISIIIAMSFQSRKTRKVQQ